MSSEPFFDAAMAFFWQPENDGQPLHITPGDPGGATAWGVVYRYWSAWRQQHGEPSGYNDFKAMPRDGFRPYLYSQYYAACRCQDLGPVGLTVFDHAGTSGTGWAAKLLQRAVGVQDDGAIGPMTISAVAAVHANVLIDRYTDARVAYYRSLPSFRHFPGWLPRAERARAAALRLVLQPPPPVV